MIGSGLSALAVVLGLERSRSVAVLVGPAQGRFDWYDERGTVPCAFHGPGGLGSHWHGVIPLCGQPLAASPIEQADADFVHLLRWFYPRQSFAIDRQAPSVFVPWKPIRPMAELTRLVRARPQLKLVSGSAQGFAVGSGGVDVRHEQGRILCRRLWVAAGALHTPQLLARASGAAVARPTVSDHVLSYIGLTNGVQRPQVRRGMQGVVFSAWYPRPGDPASMATKTSTQPAALYSLRPARFSYRRLDHAIEQRAVFGMPTGTAIAKIARRASPGLLAEALYNRFGLFPEADRYSVYAQIRLQDAYEVMPGPAAERGTVLRLRPEVLHTAVQTAREQHPFGELQLSKRAETYLPGIHLHRALNTETLHTLNINRDESPIQVVDASAIEDIGPEHHSFRMMVSAWSRAQRLQAHEPKV